MSTDWNDKIHEATETAEYELKRLIAYLNDEVVPDVRKHGAESLKKAAEQMQKLAEKLESHKRF